MASLFSEGQHIYSTSLWSSKARMCTPVQVCDAVHAGAHETFFCDRDPPGRAHRQKKTNRKNLAIAKSRFAKFRKISSAKNEIVASKSWIFALQRAVLFAVPITDKAAKLGLHVSPLPDAQPRRCTARSAPSQQCPELVPGARLALKSAFAGCGHAASHALVGDGPITVIPALPGTWKVGVTCPETNQRYEGGTREH